MRFNGRKLHKEIERPLFGAGLSEGQRAFLETLCRGSRLQDEKNSEAGWW